MDSLRRALRTVLVGTALAAFVVGAEAQASDYAVKQTKPYLQKQAKGLKRRLKIRRRSRKPAAQTTTSAAKQLRAKGTGTNNGAQTNGASGNNGAGNGASTQSGSSSNRNNSENNANNSNNNHANQTNVSGATVMAGLINVNAQNINLNVYKVIDVHNVLNNSQVEVLTQKIINSPGAKANQEVLTNLLRGAHVLNGNQIVVGVLSSMKRIFYVDKNKLAGAGGSNNSGSGSTGG